MRRRDVGKILIALLAAVLLVIVVAVGTGVSVRVSNTSGNIDGKGLAAPESTVSVPGTSGSGGEEAIDGPSMLEERAQEVLESYKAGDDCVLAFAGYLDLMGAVWSCVVVGDGWSEISLVSEGDEGDAPSVHVVRIEGEGLVITST